MSIDVDKRGRSANKGADDTGFHEGHREPTVDFLVTRTPPVRETQERDGLTLK